MKGLIYSLEDDINIAHIINVTLSKQDYNVKTFYDAKSFFSEFNNKKPDMILLDIMLPDMSGSDILKTLRKDQANDDIDIIIISAKSMIMDKVDGLDLGADDYIAKPFDLLELMSRVNAKFRKHKKDNIIQVESLVLNLQKRTCVSDTQEIELTTKEFDMLQLLMKNYPNVVSRETILNEIWGSDAELETRTIDMHIRSLRQKLINSNIKIKTVYGMGYKLKR
ncbi:MAG: response regulator transcription factor [Bacilli bacterium]